MVVTIYTRGDCPFSVALKKRLDAEGTHYSEVDLSREPRAIPELVKLTGGERVVPVLVDGGVIRVAPEGGTKF